MTDSRRKVPGTDRVLDDPAVAAASVQFGRGRVKRTVHAVQQRARGGEIEPEQVIAATLEALPRTATSVRRVLNATGVLLHTNLGRAPLSDAATRALGDAAGTTDVELDLPSGQRGPRGAATMRALLDAVPSAEAAHVVNNGAAALSLAATALAREKEIVLARGELVEIGAGFRIPDLLTATGARLREVGTTNRVRIEDYRAAVGPNTGFILKVHPSNFVISGFTSTVAVAELAELDVPVVADIGSGLLGPEPVLPDEPDATTALADGAALVTASGDKLLGGPQAGLVLGASGLVGRLRAHPLARAMRVDKLTLAALEASITGPVTPTARALHQHQSALRERAERLVEALGTAGISATVHITSATVGGGGAPGVNLPSAAVRVPSWLAPRLRAGSPSVLGRVEHGFCLLDLFALAPESDDELRQAVVRSVD